MSIPLVTADLPGTGGRIKLSPAHFVVEEIPLYEPCGAGEHLYLRVRREGRTTREVQRALADALGVAERDVGCAGQKDKVSRATQTFSLPLRQGDPDELAARAAAATGLEILAASRHGNKLGRGHLAGNRFEILVARTGAGAAARAEKIAAVLLERGLPNAYGDQRLGPGGRGARRGERRITDAEPQPSSWIARMELSAWQSALFNAWLEARIGLHGIDAVLAGDLARKTGTGGLFEVRDEAVDLERCRRGEISPTGPVYGAKMRWATGRPGELEHGILDSAGVDLSALARARLPGSRRVARIFLHEFACAEEPEGLRLRFRLEKGAYATVVLREITKNLEEGSPDQSPARSGSSQITSPGNPAASGSQLTDA